MKFERKMSHFLLQNFACRNTYYKIYGEGQWIWLSFIFSFHIHLRTPTTMSERNRDGTFKQQRVRKEWKKSSFLSEKFLIFFSREILFLLKCLMWWYETSLIHFVLFLKRHFWFINLRRVVQLSNSSHTLYNYIYKKNFFSFSEVYFHLKLILCWNLNETKNEIESEKNKKCED